MKLIGLMIGRYCPFHKGHESIVENILLDGRQPLILVGSSDENRDKSKTPLSFYMRKQLIQSRYPSAIVIPAFDFESWDEWVNDIVRTINVHTPDDVSIKYYYHSKDVDVCTYNYQGKDRTGTYHDIITELYDSVDVGIEYDINARDIRADYFANKCSLSTEVQKVIEENDYLSLF